VTDPETTADADPGANGWPTDRPVALASREAHDALVGAETPVLLAFTTPGCGLCASLAPVLDAVARLAPGVVATVDAASVPALPAAYDVRRAPTVVVLRDGREVARLDDGVPRIDALVALLERHTTV
jgi:thioredoxin-like negative regulator of GroEL